MEELINKFLYDHEKTLKNNGVFSFTQEVVDFIRERITKVGADKFTAIEQKILLVDLKNKYKTIK